MSGQTHVDQSDPDCEMPYAQCLPDSEKRVVDRATVPSFESCSLSEAVLIYAH